MFEFIQISEALYQRMSSGGVGTVQYSWQQLFFF
jgi:hypothetical protein